ncbi:MAG: alkylphosphonate utilization protein [Candidatus Nanopelagicales bacterium]|nr:alkylphosphonate utilization protein [Candidatus Nanopelagicales bacterium]MCF8551508.1 alkylphosphonate utilization protein [Candidatus Nanopelagicales bacterium]
MDTVPPCPKCSCEFTYELSGLFMCPECAHEWSIGEDSNQQGDSGVSIRDAVGNVLADGDDVTIVKDVKVKGSSSPLKVGTKVRGIRLAPGNGDHDIDAKVDGFGPMMLKSSVVKKA